MTISPQKLHNLPNFEVKSKTTGEVFTIAKSMSNAFGLKKLLIHEEVIAPGARASAAHYHTEKEELFWVLEGNPSLWNGKEYVLLEPGDVVGFPPSKENPHMIVNHGQQSAKIVTIGTNTGLDQIHYTLPMQKAMPEDVPEIARLTDAAYVKYIPRIGRKPQPMTADYSAMLETHEIWMLREQEILGFLVLQQEGKTLFIYSIVVNPAHQGRGTGKQLMLWAEAYALENGCEAVRLYTNEKMTENIAIYTHLGYTETQREDMNGWFVVHMAKSVGSDSRI